MSNTKKVTINIASEKQGKEEIKLEILKIVL